MSTLQTTSQNALGDSQTCRCLCRAYLDKTRTQRLYLMNARRMEEASLYVVGHAFRFTAAQEKEHADLLRGLLAQCGDACASPAEDVPPLPCEPLALLHAATEAEQEAGDTCYPHLAQIARQEGFPRMADIFLRIAETERLHAKRFRQYAKALAEGSLFRDAERISWLCLPCGQFHTGQEAPMRCSGCGRDQGHFIRSSFYPFSV